jgi:hypothetical protein
MPGHGLPYLALILFAPWFLILGWAYWSFPRAHVAPPHRRGFDVGVLLVALALSTAAMLWTFGLQYGSVGALWPQVIATLAAYHAFLLVLAVGALLRWRALRGRRLPPA